MSTIDPLPEKLDLIVLLYAMDACRDGLLDLQYALERSGEDPAAALAMTIEKNPADVVWLVSTLAYDVCDRHADAVAMLREIHDRRAGGRRALHEAVSGVVTADRLLPILEGLWTQFRAEARLETVRQSTRAWRAESFPCSVPVNVHEEI